jgi:hypothetical protein
LLRPARRLQCVRVSVHCAAAAPAICMPGGVSLQRNADFSSDQLPLPPRCVAMPMLGDQPPDTPSVSTATLRVLPALSVISIVRQPAIARCVRDMRAEKLRCIACEFAHLRRNLRPCIDHNSDLGAGRLQVERTAPAIIRCREDRNALARHHAEAVGISAQCRSQQDAGPVIAGKYKRSFLRASGEHALFGDDLPQPLPRHERRWHRQMIADALDGAIFAVIGAEHGGALEDADIRQRAEFGLRQRRP